VPEYITADTKKTINQIGSSSYMTSQNHSCEIHSCEMKFSSTKNLSIHNSQ